MNLQLLLVKSVLQLEAVVLKTVLGLDFFVDEDISLLELLGVSDELLDLLLGKEALIDDDGDLLSHTDGLVRSGDVEANLL